MKKIFSVLIACFVFVISFSLINKNVDEAESFKWAGGGGTSSGGTRDVKGWYTIKATTNSNGQITTKAWTNFLDSQDNYPGGKDSLLATMRGSKWLDFSESEMNRCEKAQQIWFLGDPGGAFVYNGNLAAQYNNKAKTTQNNILKPIDYYPTKTTEAQFKYFWKNFSGKEKWQSEERNKYSIICWYETLEKTTQSWTEKRSSEETQNVKSTVKGSDVENFEKVADKTGTKELADVTESITTSVTRQNLYDSEGILKNADPIGVNNLTSDVAKNTVTTYGTLLNTFSTDQAKAEKNRTYKSISSVETAVNNVKTAANAITGKSDLSAANIAGIAEGGILNSFATKVNTPLTLSEKYTVKQKWKRTKNWSATSTQKQVRTKEEKRTCTREMPDSRFNWEKMEWRFYAQSTVEKLKESEKSCTKWTTNKLGDWENSGKASIGTKTYGTKTEKLVEEVANSRTDVSVTITKGTSNQKSNFYQLLVVRCNPDDFAQMAAKLGQNNLTIVNKTADPDGTITIVATSKVTSSNNAVAPTSPDFGTMHFTSADQTVLKNYIFSNKDALGYPSITQDELNISKIISILNTETLGKTVNNQKVSAWLRAQTSGGKNFEDKLILSRSATEDFYNKECSFQCVATPSGAQATTANDATNNILSTNYSVDKNNHPSYGAQIEGINSAEFNIFRDNADRTIRFDTWYPSMNGSNPGVNYTGQAPISTIVIKDENGTPVKRSSGSDRPSVHKDGQGNFSMTTTGSNPTNVFDSSATGVKPKTQENFSDDLYVTEDEANLAGFHNKFIVKADWASANAHPHKIKVNWQYRVPVVTSLPKSMGIDSGTTKPLIDYANATTNIDGRCALNMSVDRYNKIEKVQSGTGSNTVNTLDMNNNFTPNNSVILNFIRSVSE